MLKKYYHCLSHSPHTHLLSFLFKTLMLKTNKRVPVPIDLLSGSFKIDFGDQISSENLIFSKLVERKKFPSEEMKIGE